MTEHDADTDGTDGYPTAEVSAPIDESPSSRRAAMEWAVVKREARSSSPSWSAAMYCRHSPRRVAGVDLGRRRPCGGRQAQLSLRDIHRFDVVVFDRPPGLPSEPRRTHQGA
ncbi:MAG: hypothetical protein R2710_17655 [Acidimicrobiales bacterium]